MKNTIFSGGPNTGAQPHFRALSTGDLKETIPAPPVTTIEWFGGPTTSNRGSRVEKLPEGTPWPDTKFLSKRFVLTHFLKMTDEQILEADRMLGQERAYHNYNEAMKIVKPNG